MKVNLNAYKEVSYRYDIQGVRAIGAILIMFYHIWFNKVSGGVDVFFVVSGYFMAGMLARSYLKHGKVSPFEFWGRIIRRVAPLAYTVIAATFIAGYFFMPPDLWRHNINEVLTSAMHIENWQLIHAGTDYLASSHPPSPLQQFWALSLQMQFYFILPLVLYIAMLLSKWTNSYKVTLYVLALIVISSFIFSICYTKINPIAAYFNTGSRAWEFFVGVAIFVISPFISISTLVANVLIWIGFILILAVGIIVPDSATFPGYISILPVAAAGSMIIAGAYNKTGYVHKLLSSKFLLYIGGISFSLYLWHWPILIYFQYYSGTATSNISFLEGSFIILMAFSLSVLSNILIEKPFIKIKSKSVIAPYVIASLFFIPVFISSYYARSEMVNEYKIIKANGYVNGVHYNGDGVYIQNGMPNVELKRFIFANDDLTGASLNGCSDGMTNGNISFCEFGNINSEKSILLVGGSRVAHWEPLFSYLGEKDNFKVITATMNSCSFGYHPKMGSNIDCQDWNDNIIEFISSMNPRPKVIIVNSSRTGINGEFTPPEYVENIKKVISLGIPVVGIRIGPVFKDPNMCLWKNSDNVSECATNYLSSLQEENPIIKINKEEKLNNFFPVDFTNVLCENELCPVTFDGYLALRDESHFSKSYILYLAQALEKSLDNQVGIFSSMVD